MLDDLFLTPTPNGNSANILLPFTGVQSRVCHELVEREVDSGPGLGDSSGTLERLPD